MVCSADDLQNLLFKNAIFKFDVDSNTLKVVCEFYNHLRTTPPRPSFSLVPSIQQSSDMTIKEEPSSVIVENPF